MRLLNHFPLSLHRGRKMHHPSNVPTPSLSWQPLKQSNFTPVLQLRSSSCPPWLPAPHRSGRSLPTAGLAFSVAAQRNPKVTSGFLLTYHQKHQAKRIFLPHNCPTGSWRRRCRDGTGSHNQFVACPCLLPGTPGGRCWSDPSPHAGGVSWEKTLRGLGPWVHPSVVKDCVWDDFLSFLEIVMFSSLRITTALPRYLLRCLLFHYCILSFDGSTTLAPDFLIYFFYLDRHVLWALWALFSCF